MGSKRRDPLTGRGADLQLYRAVRRYIRERGGEIVVIGGIEIQEWPNDPKGQFRVAVRVGGRKSGAEARTP
jgi:hypothetical protein